MTDDPKQKPQEEGEIDLIEIDDPELGKFKPTSEDEVQKRIDEVTNEE